jgi:hypothetical protein
MHCYYENALRLSSRVQRSRVEGEKRLRTEPEEESLQGQVGNRGREIERDHSVRFLTRDPLLISLFTFPPILGL